MSNIFKNKRAPDEKQTWVTMITPFNEKGQIDYTCVDALVEWYINNGIYGIFAVCQSSEMFFLDENERVELGRHVVERVNGRIPVVVSGHVSDSIEEQIRELGKMAETGADAIVIVTNRLARENEPEEVMRENLNRIIEAIPEIPMGLYECPYPYKRLLTPDFLHWVSSTGRFCFLKDTCCDVKSIEEKIKALKGTGLQLFNANAATLLDTLNAGSAGYCGVMLNFTPQLYTRLMDIFENDPKEAYRLQCFSTLESLIEYELYPVSCKYYMQLEGIPMTLKTRSKEDRLFTDTMKIEVEHLRSAWYELRKQKNI